MFSVRSVVSPVGNPTQLSALTYQMIASLANIAAYLMAGDILARLETACAPAADHYHHKTRTGLAHRTGQFFVAPAFCQT